MNAVLDLLRTLRLSSGIFLDCEFTAPWCVTATPIGPDDVGLLMAPLPAHVIAYHYVTQGNLLLKVDQRDPFRIKAGEIVLFPSNNAHRLGSDLTVEAVDAAALVAPPQNGELARIEHGGGGERTHILCGFLGADAPCDPVLEILPDVLRLEVQQGAAVDWIESTLRYAAQEMTSWHAGSHAMLARLAECLFVEAVRRHLDSLPPSQGTWLAGLGDPVVGRALALLHARKRQAWTVEDLAAEVGLSRSAFADRFTRLMGDPPMHYLAKQRLRSAAERLRATHEPVAQIAFDSGYGSESAFTRAFKRQLGVPPSYWRAQREESSVQTLGSRGFE
ncbi:AraC family transcriptional regulator [Mesorhizobium sp. CC13]|uniref:AraC family transcriptional regulator n=1 Tax=Mesorhizobium sp. CC13 TaxID=3029194 RepID=UPI0032641BE1